METTEQERPEGFTFEVPVHDRRFTCRWASVDELVVGRTFVVQPAVESLLNPRVRVGHSIVGVESVEVLGDRTNTVVRFTDGTETFGNWSRMTFMELVEAPAV